MTTLWAQVGALKQPTLATVRGRRFDIVSVDDHQVWILIHSSGKKRAIKREEFEQADGCGLVRADVVPSQLRKAGVSERNPAYVVGIIRAVIREESNSFQSLT